MLKREIMINDKLANIAASNLNTDLLRVMLQAAPAVQPSADIEHRLWSNLQRRIGPSGNDQYFMFASQSKWKTLVEGVQTRVLFKEGKVRSYLLKLAANARLPGHSHPLHEETLVLSGEVWLDGVHCVVGDYHFAKAGSQHKEVRTEHGCMLLVKAF